MRIGIDYAYGGPPPIAALKRANVKFVGRYLSLDPSKNITVREYQSLCKQGLGVIVAWETTATRALAGRAAGREDARLAEAQRATLGMPAHQVIYLAVDFDAQGPEIQEYFRGAHDVLEDRTGAYGGHKALKHLFDTGLIHHGWQTYAWSGGRWDRRAHIRQYSNGHRLGGVDVDYDVDINPPRGPYVPGDEHNWIREYDRLKHERRAPARRIWLRRTMTRRRKLIWHLAQKTGWSTLNRTNRYHELARRTK